MSTAPPAAPAANNVLAQIAALQRMGVGELRKQWEVIMETPPPGSTACLRQWLIHRIQELAYGGLAPAVKATLDKVARRDAGEDKPAEKASIPGTRFIREWRGHRHEVTTIADGFEYLGRPYRSLTAVAKAITGQHTSGQLFFGLRARGGDK